MKIKPSKVKVECIDCEIVLKQIKKYRWEVTKPITVKIDNWQVTIPVGFWTDIASVPRIFWSCIPPYGNHSLAAVVHDFLYVTNLVGRAYADDIFYALMRYKGVDKVRAYIMWLAVRLFGGFIYKKYSETAAYVRQKYNLQRPST